MKIRLNKDQRLAVDHKKGPLLIIAGAGTGKTTVITERIKSIISSGRADPSEILALTFTEKASQEMETRIDVALPYGYTQMWISTFHSFCDRVLRAEALHIGLDPKFKLLTAASAVSLLKKHLFDFDLEYFRPLGNPTRFLAGLLQHFARLQDEDVLPEKYLEWAKRQKGKSPEEKEEADRWRELAKAFTKYDELKIMEGFMDFGDLITKTLLLFRKRKSILARYQKQFKYILVDEFQDTNYAQNELAILLAGSEANITVSGDDDQSIYRFRGAAVSNILQFRKTYPKAKVVTLTKNYRSTQKILDKAHALIKHNNPDRLEEIEGVDKRLKALVRGGDPVKLFHADRVENEAELVAKEVGKLLEEGYSAKDVAILVRANKHAEPFIRAMSRNEIPVQFLGPARLYRQSEIIDLIAYLRFLVNPDDTGSLYRVLSIDEFGISQRELLRLLNIAKNRNESLLSVCDRSHKKSPGLVKALGTLKKHIAMSREETAGQLVYYFLQDFDLLSGLLDPETEEAEQRAKNISKFFDKLKTFETENADASPMAVVDWIDLAIEVGESPLAASADWTKIDAVNVLTIHSAKGLEFPVVFLVNLVSQRFPSVHRKEQIPIPDKLIKESLPKGDYHVQEERRLFYVGMTRAAKRLIFTAADYYGESKRAKKLSPFIFEALGEEALSQEVTSPRMSTLSRPGIPKPKVQHRKPVLHIDYLSYSQIQTFNICPLHYKLRYVAGIPTPANAALSFGSSIHGSLKDYYESKKKFSEREMTICLTNNWITEGYRNKKHEEQMFKRGKKYLHEYARKNKRANTIATEQPFVVTLPGEEGRGLKIGGRIDRIDNTKEGIEIVDYKTGERIPTQREVDNNLQLTIYAMAATRIKGAPFGQNPGKVKLSMYFLDTQEKLSTIRTKAQLTEAVEELFVKRREIEESDFACSKGFLCRACEYLDFCKSE